MCAHDEWYKAGIEEVDAGNKDGVPVREYQEPPKGLEGVSENEKLEVDASYYGYRRYNSCLRENLKHVLRRVSFATSNVGAKKTTILPTN